MFQTSQRSRTASTASSRRPSAWALGLDSAVVGQFRLFTSAFWLTFEDGLHLFLPSNLAYVCAHHVQKNDLLHVGDLRPDDLAPTGERQLYLTELAAFHPGCQAVGERIVLAQVLLGLQVGMPIL